MKRLTGILTSARFLVLGDQAIYSATSFVSTLCFARLLNTRDFGIFSTVILVNFLIISITNALVIQPLQVNISSVTNVRSYTAFNFIFQVLITLPVLAVLCLSGGFLFSGEFRPVIFSAALFSFGFILHDFFRKSFLAQNKVKKAFFTDALLALTQFTAIVLLHASEQKEQGTALLYSGIAYFPSLCLALFYFAPDLSSLKEWRSYLRLHVSQGKWLLLVAALQWGSGNLFVLMSGLIISIEALGALRLVQSLFGILNILLQTFENYVLPQAARLYKNSVPDSKNYLRSVSTKAAILFGSVLLILCLFSSSFITLAGGEKYATYGYLIQGMSLLYFIIFMGYPIRMSIRMLILNKSFFTGYLLSFLFSIATYHFFIQRWQLGGVVAGLIINQLVMLCYWQYQLSKNKFYLWK